MSENLIDFMKEREANCKQCVNFREKSPKTAR